MPKKLNREYVKKYFEEHGCTLLEKNWNGCFYKMQYICVCGGIGLTDWAHFSQGRRCLACGAKRRMQEKKRKCKRVF